MDTKRPLFNADAAEEYFTNLCIYYRDTRNDIFKRDNEGRHASEHIYSAECQKFLGMELAMREVLEYFSKFDLGPAPGEPLTLEELREMDGQPVYLPIGKCWALVGENEFGPLLVFSNVDDCSAKDWYENCGQAYRRPPTEEGECHGAY